jgi:hypothetical protein
MQRFLPGIAIVQGLAIVVLFGVWIRREPEVGAQPPDRAAPAPPASEPVAATGAGPASATAPAPRADEAPGAPASAASPAQALLFGSIVAPKPNPEGNGWLTLKKDKKQVAQHSGMRDSAYAFVGLAPGTYELAGQAPDCVPFASTVEVKAPHTRFDVRFEEAWNLLVHVVTPDGKPLVEALRTQSPGLFLLRGLRALASRTPLPRTGMFGDQGPPERIVGQPRSGDMFDRSPLPKTAIGSLALPPGRALHISVWLGPTVLAAQEVPAGQPEVTFVCALPDAQSVFGTVRMRLVDGATGKPAAAVKVALNDPSSYGGGTETDAEGRVTFTNLVPGALRLNVMSSKLQPPPLVVDVAAGADLDLGDVPLLPAVQVRFEVPGFGERSSCTLSLLDGPTVPWCRSDPQSSGLRNGEGGASLYPGRWRLFGRSEDSIVRAEIDTRTAGAEPIRLSPVKGCKLVLDNRVGEGLVRITMHEPNQPVPRIWTMTGTYEQTFVVAPGEIGFEWTDLAGKVARKTVRVDAAGARIIVP